MLEDLAVMEGRRPEEPSVAEKTVGRHGSVVGGGR